MRRRRTARRVIAVALAAAAAACGGTDGSPTGTAPGGGGSSASASSHNAGRDCLECHRELRVAGTVYRADGSTYPGVAVRLTTAAEGQGTVVLTLATDRSGNFYSSQAVSFGSGLFADVAGSGARRAMPGPVASGACNSCHDASNRIRAD
ncbi:MAG TPA: hypothetical protein VGB87_24555 [Vicinamibacteria bacterium]